MSTATQYNPNRNLNAELLAAGASKTVYAMVTPQTEAVKNAVLGDTGSAEREAYMSQFREAWTGKQDAYHTDFFNTWHEWSKPVVDLDRDLFPFFYPTAGASEPLRQIIFDLAARRKVTPDRPFGQRVHFFEGEYEGYKAMAEAANLEVAIHQRNAASVAAEYMAPGDLFFISQPSAIDGNVWHEFNEFVEAMPDNSVVADITYVGAVPRTAITERFNLNAPSIRNVVFSLSKPFGLYYDRVGGVFSRVEDLGLFGNKWFKNLTSLAIGTAIMKEHGVFDIPERYADLQMKMALDVADKLSFEFRPSDVYILATAESQYDSDMAVYLRRAGKLRICLTPGMVEAIS